MEIQDYKTGDETAILDLFEIVFHKKMQQSYWDWRFKDNPAGKYLIKLMWEGNNLIGHYAVSPFYLRIENENILAALSMTTMIHPKYENLGVFGLLAKALYDKIDNEIGVKAILGFPNNNSHYSFIRNLEWIDLGQISHMIINADRIPALKSECIKINSVFNDEHANLLSKISQQFKISTLKDANYLNWRYILNPTSNYSLFEYIDNNILKGFMVVKKFPSMSNPKIFDLYITEIGFEKQNSSLLRKFLSHIVSYYGQRESTINAWISLFDNRYISFEKIGFQPGGKPTFVCARLSNSVFTKLFDFRNLNLSYGDSDVY